MAGSGDEVIQSTFLVAQWVALQALAMTVTALSPKLEKGNATDNRASDSYIPPARHVRAFGVGRN